MLMVLIDKGRLFVVVWSPSPLLGHSLPSAPHTLAPHTANVKNPHSPSRFATTPTLAYHIYPFNCRCAVLSFNPSKRIRQSLEPTHLSKGLRTQPPPCPLITANSLSTAKLASPECLASPIGDSAVTNQARVVCRGCSPSFSAIYRTPRCAVAPRFDL
jgi:hypothetical protein